jgi:lipopolysaccharide/colanic/teichoic acid biosynthesis glycosyltransferase
MFQPSGYSTGEGMLTTADVAVIPLSYAEPAFSTPSNCNGPAKRFFDIVGSLILLAFWMAPMLLIALAISCDSHGPILFCQRRIGYANVGFTTLKFRTMHHTPVRQGALRQATRNDRRVTRVGAFLRRWSLDELPQLYNVLRGDMSLVGPRPHAPGTCAGGKPFEMVTPRYYARHRVRPGITGLAQIRGLRGETETEEKLLRRVAADLEYIEKWSFRLDLTILARTAISVACTRNAY